ncbi:hypothetical protein FB2170_00635 [Maribacter sp. HTCC2170]|nr:hypothetical protein FB2170_00635 [Maribacter sp. HTCC2170]
MVLVTHAHNNRPAGKISTTEKGFALANVTITAQQDFLPHRFRQPRDKMASIYKYRNTKIKRALSFTTRRDRPKLA